MQVPEELYAAIHETLEKEDEVPSVLTRKFKWIISKGFIKSAFYPHEISENFHKDVLGDVVRKINAIPDLPTIECTGAEELQNCSLICVNHQGPGSERNKSDENSEPQGEGGLESLLTWAMIPPRSRYVLKSSHVYPPDPTVSNMIQAQAYFRTDPIPVFRPDEEMETSAYVKAMKVEQERVAEEIVYAINKERKPVVLHPEGTRSPTGNIRPFITIFFRKIYEEYVLPHIHSDEEMRIGVIVADTLKALKNGFSRDVPMYKMHVRLHGMRYNPTELIERTHEEEAKDPSERNYDAVARFFANDMRAVMERKLCEMIQMS